MSFAWPWLFLALPLPWLLQRLHKDNDVALRLPALPAQRALPSRRKAWAASLAWLLLVVAVARPQMIDGSAPQVVSGRDLVLAFDVSDSMALADLLLDRRPVTRLQAARAVADDFLSRRTGDRVGLIVFGSRAYVHTPLTHDLHALRAALAGAETGLAGRETALGDAVALAVAQLKALPDQARVLVLLSDGANTAGTLTPERATWLAQREHVRVHAVAIGPESDGLALKRLSEETGGSYLHAGDGDALAAFFKQLDRIEPGTPHDNDARPMIELYAWPLAAALLLACGLLLPVLRKEAA